PLEPEVGRGVRRVSTVVLERARDQVALDLVHHLAQRHAGPVIAAATSASAGDRKESARLCFADLVAGREDHEPLDQIAQLADVAWIVVATEQLERAVRDRLLATIVV